MNTPTPAPVSFYLGWDVGGWNCDKNKKSRDAIVIVDPSLSVVGLPWRGNLRKLINESSNTSGFIKNLFSLCNAKIENDAAGIILAVDTPFGFSDALVGLISGLEYTEPIESSGTNPYLFRKTERYLKGMQS